MCFCCCKNGLKTLKDPYCISKITTSHWPSKILNYNWKSIYHKRHFSTKRSSNFFKKSNHIRPKYKKSFKISFGPQKVRKQKIYTFTFMRFLVRALPKVQNWFQKQFCVLVRKNLYVLMDFSLYFKILLTPLNLYPTAGCKKLIWVQGNLFTHICK